MHHLSRRSVIEQGLWAGLGLVLLPATSWARRRGSSMALPPTADDAADDAADGPTPDAPPPWAAIAPYGPGASLPLGWTVAGMTPVVAGSALLTLRHSSGDEAVVRLVRRGAKPIGIAQTEELDLLLVNGAKGRTVTDESLSRVLLTFAAAIRAHRDVDRSAARALKTLAPTHC